MRRYKTENNYRTGTAVFVLLCSLALTACQGAQNTGGNSQEESRKEFFAMDTYMTFTAYGDNAGEALERRRKRFIHWSPSGPSRMKTAKFTRSITVMEMW